MTMISRRHLPILALAAVSLVWGALAFYSIDRSALGLWHEWDQSDMHAYLAQADRIAGGDLLARDPFYPYHIWMGVAPPEKWASWYGPRVFYQAPLYSYFLAVLIAAKQDPARAARVVQLFMLPLISALMFLFTRRLFGRRAALFAGLLTALYGPLIMIASQPLKETLALALTLGILLLLAKVLGAPISRSASGKYIAIGALIGVLAMLHEGTPPLLLTAIAVIALRARSRSFVPIGLLVAAAIIGFSPLLIRNLMVDASPLAVSTRSPITWALANTASALNGGVTWSPPTESFVRMMDAAAGRPFGIVAGVLGSYEGRPWQFFAHWAMRAAALLTGGEAADNTCYAYFRLYVPILSLSIDFRWLLPLAVAGLMLRPRRRADLIIPIYLVLMMAALSAVFPLGRLRLFLLPALAPLAGHAIARLWAAIQARRGGRLLIMAVAIIVTIFVQIVLDKTWHLGDLRPADFGVAARIEMTHGRPDLAVEELERGAKLLNNSQLARQAEEMRGLLKK